MKTIANQIHEVKGDDFKTIAMKVDDSKLAKLYGMLSNIYRNPIGAIVREYTSNAHDANVEAHNFKELSWDDIQKVYPWVNDPSSKLSINEAEFNELKKTLSKAGKDEPIIVDVDREKMEFVVKDYGIGLSPERMENVFFGYLSSTKEDTDSEIGGFGIGAKSALAYTNTFFINTVYNGVEYQYMMTKNAKGMPEGKLVLSKKSNDHNGTVIRVPIKEWGDLKTFNSEISKQLLYIPNVYYNSDRAYCNINEYRLYKGDGWVYCPDSEYEYMHVVLDNIPYQIDWSELGMRAIEVKFGLVFATGELHPTPSRESILYTPATIKKIQDRIEKIRREIYQKVLDKRQPTDDLLKAWEALNETLYEFDILEGIGDDPVKIDLDNLFESSDTISKSDYRRSTPYKPLMGTGISLDFFQRKTCIGLSLYGALHLNDAGKIKTISDDSSYTKLKSYRKVLEDLLGDNMVIISNSKISQMEAHYMLESMFSRDEIKTRANDYYTNKIQVYRARKIADKAYKDIVDPNNIDKKDVRDKKIEAVKALDKVIMDLAGVNTVLPDPNYQRLYRAGKCFYKPKATVSIPTGMIKLKAYDKYPDTTRSDSSAVEAAKLPEFGKNVIYGDNTDIGMIKMMRDFVSSSVGGPKYYNKSKRRYKYEDVLEATEFVVVYKSDLKIIKQLNMENWYHVNDAINDYKPIRRAITALYLNRIFSQYDNLAANYTPVSKELRDDLGKLNSYISSNTSKYFSAVNNAHEHYHIHSYLIDTCIANDGLDWSIMEIANRVSKLLSRSIALNAYLQEAHYSRSLSTRLMYTRAKALINSGVPVEEKYHLRFREFMLREMIENWSGNGYTDRQHARVINQLDSHLSSAETCLYEDFNGTEEYLKLFKDKTDGKESVSNTEEEGGLAQAV